MNRSIGYLISFIIASIIALIPESMYMLDDGYIGDLDTSSIRIIFIIAALFLFGKMFETFDPDNSNKIHSDDNKDIEDDNKK